MGSPKVLNIKATPPDENEKRSFKSILRKPFQALFLKEKKKDIKNNEKETIRVEPKKVIEVDAIIENLHKLKIDKRAQANDEFDNFTVKIIKDQKKDPIGSHISKDSGFSEHTHDKEYEPTNNVKESEFKEEEKKQKKLQTVFVSRGPIRNKAADFTIPAHPYGGHVNQINQINTQTFTGGQVIVNEPSITKNYPDYEIDLALTAVERNVQNFRYDSAEEQDDLWQIAQEFIKDASNNESDSQDILAEFLELNNPFFNEQSFIAQDTSSSHTDQILSPESRNVNIDTGLSYVKTLDKHVDSAYCVFPTPSPEYVSSPGSSSSPKSYHTNSDWSTSTELASPSNNNYEHYQEISPLRNDSLNTIEPEESIDKQKPCEKKNSSSSMTMKQYKDLQKELSMGFSKFECCQLNRKSCRELIQENLDKIDLNERRNLCHKVANLDLTLAYGVLNHIMLHLSKSSEQEDLHCSLFALLCDRVLAEKPALYIDDFGLGLLKAAVLRCPQRPLLTRYIVQCIRSVLKTKSLPNREFVFNEVDAIGDNLVSACARGGDTFADVLHEIVNRDHTQMALFDVRQVNSEGHAALHVACILHTTSSPRLRTVHVLLEHGHADLWQGDVKGGDTAVHLAVNSTHCDLNLLMTLFRHVDRKMWKQLAHSHNRSSVTPLEFARSATKSTTRQNYPLEVLEFLRKCR